MVFKHFHYDERAIFETFKRHSIFRIEGEAEKAVVVTCTCQAQTPPAEDVAKARELWAEHYIKELRGPALS